MEIRLSQNKTDQIDKIPNKCPWCHLLIEPKYVTFNYKTSVKLELVFKCTNSQCNQLFIAYYYYQSGYGQTSRLQGTNKGTLVSGDYSTELETVSPSFIMINNQAFFAEQNNLLEICGVGYRKALEFLIKDYLIFTKPDLEDEIKNKFLGKCIRELVEDDKIKTVAKRAAWLGNDETHYTRKWENKDLQDMKKLIKLTVHWIEMDMLTQSFEEEMPE